MVHLHARGSDNEPTWKKEVYSEIISEIRSIDQDIIIVVSTSGRNWSDITKRSDCLMSIPKPDMASLTLGSLNFPTQSSINSPESIRSLAMRMSELSIVPELEIFDAGMINYASYLSRKNLLKPPYYFNLIFGSLGSASLNATNIAAMINSLPNGSTWAIGGIGRFQLAATSIGIALGGHVRIGLEDNPFFSWSTKEHATNIRLVERVARIAKELGREIATPTEARNIIGIE